MDLALPHKRKAGTRTKSGRLSRAYRSVARDLGTKESQQKRHELINGSPVELAATASGILFANAHLTERQHFAAIEYRRMWCIALGKPSATSGSTLNRFLPWQGGEIDEEGVAKAERKLRRCNEALSDEQRDAVIDVAIFQFIPSWFAAAKRRMRAPTSEVARREALLAGLDRIADALGLSRTET